MAATDLRHEGGMSRKGVGAVAFSDVPDAAGVVVAAGGEEVAIGGPVHGEDVLHMPFQGHDAPAAPQIPDAACDKHP